MAIFNRRNINMGQKGKPNWYVNFGRFTGLTKEQYFIPKVYFER